MLILSEEVADCLFISKRDTPFRIVRVHMKITKSKLKITSDETTMASLEREHTVRYVKQFGRVELEGCTNNKEGHKRYTNVITLQPVNLNFEPIL